MHETLFLTFKLLLAALLGGIVGYEREVHEHPAGLRTHILVCMGAALITMVSISFRPPDGDPGRIAAQIVSGIGFLGAGTILRQGNIVRGLTTAASLWTVAGIGIAVGVGEAAHLILAMIATGVVFLVLSTTHGIERRSAHKLIVEMQADKLHIIGESVQKLVQVGASIKSITSIEPTEESRRAFLMRIALPRSVRSERIVEILAEEDDLDRFEWR